MSGASPWNDQAVLRQLVAALVRWQRAHGRSGLPWQNSADPYRVWLSEIMLQQTQVATVRAYYQRFLQRFVSVNDLAAAPLDEVLQLWAGLGYYSRARNLHACAQRVVSDWGGAFPRSAAQLQTLPGIGATTAAAIAAFCFGQRVSIVDGNVKRVLGRCLALPPQWPASRHARAVNALAQRMAQCVAQPADMGAYTQGLMDLGARLCQPRQVECARCPLATHCAGCASGQPLNWPPRSAPPSRQVLRWWLVFVRNDQGLWAWQRRSAKGIWGGLMVPLILDDAQTVARDWSGAVALPMFRHLLTHRELLLYPLVVRSVPGQDLPADVRWCDAAASAALAMPVAVQRAWRLALDQPPQAPQP